VILDPGKGEEEEWKRGVEGGMAEGKGPGPGSGSLSTSITLKCEM
jgi:hypothetical protein